MKPKGWKLDPRWIEYYAEVEKQRLKREMDRIQSRWQRECFEAEMAANLKYQKALPAKSWLDRIL